MKTVPSTRRTPVMPVVDRASRLPCAAPDNVELFFPVGTSGPALQQTAEAKTLCMSCPILQACREDALARPAHFAHGVVGPWRPLGVVLGVDGPDPLRELDIGPGTLVACRGGLDPGVVGRALDLDELTESLHLEGGGVVGDELEATHQRVSPAKYLAAR